MSSLRLALKQSLQESGLNPSSTDWKKKNKKKSRLNMHHVSDDRDHNKTSTRESPGNSTNRTRHKRKVENVEDQEDSEENEFSAMEEDEYEEDENAEENSEQDEDENDNGKNRFDSENNDNGEGASDSSGHRKNRQRKNVDPLHDEHRKKQHSAANKIQSRWKRKQNAKTSKNHRYDDDEEGSSVDENDGDDATGRTKRRSQGLPDKARHSTKGSESSTKRSAATTKETVSRNKQKQSGGSKSVTTKSMTVAPPEPSVIQWMNDMPVKRSRQNIVPGMRVKVRFATKVVVRRKDSNAEGQDNIPLKKQVVRKKKWFGGLVSAVSKEGSKIRIKYDDGTVEVTKFPDKDVVVDDIGNGDHQVSADCFIPPPPSPCSPPIGKKSLSMLIGAGGGSDLVDTPMQQHVTSAMIDIEAAPKLVLGADSDQHDQADDGNAVSAESGMQTPQHAHNSNDEERAKIENTQLSRQTSGGVATESLLDICQSPSVDKPNEVEVSNQLDVTSALSPMDLQQNTSINALQMNDEAEGIPNSDSITHDQASIDTNELTSHNRRKRGRASKDDVASADDIPFNDAKLNVTESTGDATSPIEPNSRPDDSKHQPSKPTLKIRIANIRTESDKSPRPLDVVGDGELNKLDQNNDPEQSKKKKKKKKKTQELSEGSQDPALSLKKIKIQVASPGLTEENETENVKNQQKIILSLKPPNNEQDASSDNLKRKITEREYPDRMRSSPVLSPRQRKKQKKLMPIPEEAVISSLDLLPPPELMDGSKIADATTPVHTTKSIRIKKSSNNIPTPPLTSKKKMVLQSTKSSSELSLPVSDPDRPGSPTDDVKKDSLEAPTVRSGRRAAQQANERIASKQDPPATDPGGKKKKKKKDDDAENVEIPVADLLEDIKWVECDKCKKWRVIPSSVVDTLPNQWFCSDNIYDPKRANCDVPQQSDKQVAKERKRKLKKQQQMLQVEGVMSEPEVVPSVKPTQKETKDLGIVKENSTERSRSPVHDLPKEDSPGAKTKRESPVELTVLSESGSEAAVHLKQERRMSAVGKKVKQQTELVEKNLAAESVADVVRRGRGRPRRNQKELPVPGSSNCDGIKPEDDNVEWVKCDKCGKWRRLPSHISADDLPELWYCEMNTWNPEAASCDEPGDTADGSQDIGGFGAMAGLGIGKLTYRNLIFGSTGRKANRQVSERARAAESLFSVHFEDDEAPTRVLYADSCAFVSRGRPTLLPDDNEHKSVLELMSHSHLWTELRSAANSKFSDYSFIGHKDRKPPASCFTFDTLPQDVVLPMKEMVLFYLADSTLSGEQLVSRGEASLVGSVSSDFEKAREFWNANVVVTTIAQLIKEGKVECLRKISPGETVATSDSYVPCYRKVVTSSNRSTVSNESGDKSPSPSQLRSSCRCMKIAKPWKATA